MGERVRKVVLLLCALSARYPSSCHPRRVLVGPDRQASDEVGRMLQNICTIDRLMNSNGKRASTPISRL